MKKFLTICAVVLSLCWYGCGGSSDATTDTSTVNVKTVDALPKATSPVVAAAAASASKSLQSISKSMMFDPAGGPQFAAGKSMAACESYNQIQESVRSAAEADMILCFVQTLASQNAFAAVDIYDGQYHIFDLNITGGDGGAPDKVKLKVSKDASGNITLFEMFMCKGGAQSEYVNQSITSGNLNMVSKGIFADANWNGHHEVLVEGKLNSTGQYTSKTITTKQFGGDPAGNNTNRGQHTTVQSVNQWTLEGANSGGWSNGGHTGTYSSRVHVEAALMDNNAAGATYDVTKLGIGDGAAKAIFNNTSPQGGNWQNTVTEGWNGTSLAQDNTVNYFSTVNAVADADLPPAIAAPDPVIEFGSTQSWDCSGTSESTITGSQGAMNAACSQYGAMNHNWINCYDLIKPNNP